MKTNINDLTRIFSNCMKEGRDEQTALEQIQGEIYANSKSLEVARTVGTDAFRVIKENYPWPSSQSAAIAAIHNTLSFRYSEVLYSSRR